MASEVTVTRIKPTEWGTYKDLRIEALKESPDSFGGTFADAVKQEDLHWKNRVANSSDEFDLPLFAWSDGFPAGLAWGKIFIEKPEDAHLFQMWVSPDFRGRKAGKKLLETVIAWAREKGAARLLLGVTTINLPARRLYESAGFVPSGQPEPLREGSELMSQPMELKLH